MKIRQHEALRVPQGWSGQDKALIMQLERVFNDLYRLLGGHDEAMVTAVTYDTVNKKLTVTIGGETTDIVTVATIKTDMALTKSDVGLSNVENKSSATIRSEITSTNVTNALGYVPLQYHQDISGKADKSETVTEVSYDGTNKKITRIINGSTADVVTVATIKSALGSFTWGALAGR